MKLQVLYTKYLRLYLLFAVIILPLCFMQRAEDAYYLPKSIILLGMLQHVFYCVMNAGRRGADTADKALCLFLFVYASGLFGAPDKKAAFYGYMTWLAAAGAYLYAKNFLGAKEKRKFIAAALISASVTAGYAVLQAFGADLGGWVTDFGGRAFSSTGNPDFLGGFLLLVIPLSLVYLAIGNGHLPLAVFIFYFLASALFLSRTRTSLAAFAVSLPLMFFFFGKAVRKNAALMAAGLAVFMMAVIASGNAKAIGGRLLNAFDRGSSDFSQRVEMWDNALSMAKAKFAGQGISSVRTHRHYFTGKSQEYYETSRVHNDYLEIAAESGFAAAAAFVFFCGALLVSLFRKNNPLAGAAFISISALLVHALLNFPFYVIDTKLYFFLIAGMGAGRTVSGFKLQVPKKDDRESGTRNQELNASTAAFMLVVNTIIMTAVFISGFRALISSAYLNAGINAKNAGDVNAAMYSLLKSNEPAALYNLADIYSGAGDRDKAKERIAAFLKKEPMSKRGRSLGGIILAERKNYVDALKAFNYFLEHYPEDTDILNNKAKTLYLGGRPDIAAKVYEKVLEIDPGDRVAEENLRAIQTNAKGQVPIAK